MRRFANCLLLLLGHVLAQFASADPYGSGWYQELQLSVGFEDNVSRSYKPVDVTDDAIASASFGIGYTQKLRDNIQYVFSGYLTYNRHNKFDALSNLATSLGTSIVYQPTANYDSPWYRAALDVTRLDYRDSPEREGYLFDGEVSFNKRLGMHSNIHVGYRYHDLVFDKSETDELHDAAFDVARHEAFVGVEYHFSQSVFLVSEYAFQHGGLTSSVSGTTDPSFIYEADTEDPAFQSCTVLLCTAFYAYRSVADIHVLDVGLVYSRGAVSYDLSGRYYDASSENGPDYKDWVVRLGMVWDF